MLSIILYMCSIGIWKLLPAILLLLRSVVLFVGCLQLLLVIICGGAVGISFAARVLTRNSRNVVNDIYVIVYRLVAIWISCTGLIGAA